MKLLTLVKELEHTNDVERLAALKGILKRYKIPFTAENYESGQNIIIGKGDILFTAHYDTVFNSPGANDDASAMAVLIGLAKARKAAIAIFDEEELGYIGAKAYIEKHGLPKAVIDLELMGMGDMMAIWTVEEERPMLEKIRKALRKAKITFEEARKVPIFWADFTAFREAGLKDAWCLTLAPSSEKELIRNFATRPLLTTVMTIFGQVPKLFKYYHSSKDNSSNLTEKALQLSLKAVISIYDELKRKP